MVFRSNLTHLKETSDPEERLQVGRLLRAKLGYKSWLGIWLESVMLVQSQPKDTY